jgi:toxin ParE1/3/4
VTRKPKALLLLTQRVLEDLAGVLEYSTDQWGKKPAEKYLDDIEAGLERLRQEPDLLQPLPDRYPPLTYYRVNKHLLVCDFQADSIVLLTVIHGCMDIPNRLADLQPTLATEVEMLHNTLRKFRRRKS